MFEIIDKLAKTINGRWRQKKFARSRFAQIAADALTEFRLHETLPYGKLAGRLAGAASLPAQHDTVDRLNLPKYAFTLYSDKRFYVDLFAWFNASMVVHDHDFEGAFVVLEGKDLHGTYAFDVKETLGKHLRTGSLRSLDAVVLSRGDVTQVLSGEDLIHAVWHLTHPTVAINVRTHAHPRRQGYSYFRSGLSSSYPESASRDELCLKRMQMINYLSLSGADETDAYARDIIAKDSPINTYHYIERYLALRHRDDVIADALDKKRKKSGAWVDVLRRHFLEQDPYHQVHWKTVVKEEHNFLLSLLQTFPRKRDILAHVADYAPGGNAAEKVRGWLKEIRAIGGFDLDLPRDVKWPADPRLAGIALFRPLFTE